MDILRIAASFVSVLGIVSIIYFIYKWITAPKFIIGVVPTKEEIKEKNLGEIGKRSFFDEIHFSKKILAKPVRREKQLEKINDIYSTRIIKRKNNKIELPIVVQNIGKREASFYAIGIAYTNQDIHITDVKTETLGVDGFYVQKECVENKKLKEKIPDEKIIKSYEDLNLTRDYLSLIGALGSHTFEMIYLTLKVPTNLHHFYIIFRIDCPEAFLRRRIYAQKIIIRS